MKHPYADILIAIAEGKEIQWQDSVGVWLNEPVSCALMEIRSPEYSPRRYRVKPATININGVECEAPVEGGNGFYVAVSAGYGVHKKAYFATDMARDAAFAALIKPFREVV